MKKHYYLLIITFLSFNINAQAPQGFNYQATVRNATGDLVVKTNVYFKFNIIQGSLTSLPLFSESHYVPTDDVGQVSLIIGEGTAATNLSLWSEIDWSLGSYFLGIELNTGSGYVAMGTTQLLSVPFALYAESSGSAPATTLEAVLVENNSANNQQIKNLQNPIDAQDAVTKAYVGDLIVALETNLQEVLESIDNDYDGYTENQGDCDDSNAAINPGAVEVQDTIDNNCNGEVDELDLTFASQQWTTENAIVETYRDGTEIPEVTDQTQWSNLTTGAWCYYENDATKEKLYNWYAVMGIYDTDESTPNKEFAPEGWHVPTKDEWAVLEQALITNGSNYDNTTTENKIAKSMVSKVGWTNSTTQGSPGSYINKNNSSGFNALPNGYRGYSSYGNEGNEAFFYSTTLDEVDPEKAWIFRLIYNNSSSINTSINKTYGFSVRFVKN